MPKKVVLSGYFGFDNFGDEAILYVLSDILKSLGHSVTVLSSNPEKTTKIYNTASVKNFDIIKLIKTIFRSDILFSGGGSLLQDVTSFKSLFYYSLVIFIALCFRKKVVIFAQGIGPLNKDLSKFIVKNLLKHATYISVRDENSLELLKSWNINAELVNDPVFSLPVPQRSLSGKVGVQLRDFSTMNDLLLKKLAQSVVKEFSDKKIEIFVFQKSIDQAVCTKFNDIIKSLNPNLDTEIITNLNRKDIIDRISDLEYMIAMRFHALIIALKAGVKSMGINYDIKVEKLAQEASIPLISVDGSDDYEKAFFSLKSLNSEELRSFSAKKEFNWDKIEQLLAE